MLKRKNLSNLIHNNWKKVRKKKKKKKEWGFICSRTTDENWLIKRQIQMSMITIQRRRKNLRNETKETKVNNKECLRPVFAMVILQLFGSIIFLEFPMDPGIILSASLNGDLLFVFTDGQTVLTAPVLYVIRLSKSQIKLSVIVIC